MKEKLNLLYANLAEGNHELKKDCARVITVGGELGKGEYDVLGCLWEKVFQFKWSVGIESGNN